jgi:glycosyltransferase involved in cell wall biosynthesis
LPGTIDRSDHWGWLLLRVGFLCDIFELGGQEQGCLEVLRRLNRKRFKPYLYTFRAGKLLEAVRRLRIPIMVGTRKRASDPTWTLRDRRRREKYNRELAARMRKDRIDVCIIYAWKEGVTVAQQAGVRAVVERLDGFGLLSRVRNKSGCQRIICQSHTIRKLLVAQRQLLKCRREQLVVVPNGIDLRRFNPSRYDRDRCRKALRLKSGDFVIGAVARLAPQKNFEHLLRATRLLIDRGKDRGDPGWPRVRVVIAGPDGGSKDDLIALAKKLRIADRVRFLGSRSDVPEVMRAFDVFAIPSFHEGTPFALLEAMAMELPIVASQVGSIPEIIDGNGYLICVLQPSETRDALSDLIEDPALRRRLGCRSRELAASYSIEGMVRGYERALLEAVRLSRMTHRRKRSSSK